ncbi:discoidin domain-containing protein [Paenibacillus lautus]|uniref:discoidin domain-containing protein n=1 Tax=Paenibacillus lautus TaxID=1401 RepID=UPI002DBA968B|nr:discoidin domain-containing protein [Paenibacillus lautus]MEC0201401.1 discoidin domain-containing protein [Paenibacillus lautus]
MGIKFPYYSPDKAVDGNESTRWSSTYVDDAWFLVDLGENKEINKVTIKWQGAYAEKYQILVSGDNIPRREAGNRLRQFVL